MAGGSDAESVAGIRYDRSLQAGKDHGNKRVGSFRSLRKSFRSLRKLSLPTYPIFYVEFTALRDAISQKMQRNHKKLKS